MDKIKLGQVDDIPAGQGRCFIVGEEEIAVFRPRSGELCAIQNRCPHKGGPLAEGLCDANKVICPYHGYQFDLHTGQGPGEEKVKVYEVQEENGEIILFVKHDQNHVST